MSNSIQNHTPNDNTPVDANHQQPTAAHPHDAMIQDSMTNNATLNAQVQADLVQQHTQNAQQAQDSTQAFGTTQGLPQSAPQGQQMTRPANHTSAAHAQPQAHTQTAGYYLSLIHI